MARGTQAERKFAKVMREFEAGTLRTSFGGKVTSRAQAQAIAASEAGVSRQRPKKKKSGHKKRKK